MNTPSIPLYSIIHIFQDVSSPPILTEFLMHPKYGLFHTAPGITKANIDDWVLQMPAVDPNELASAAQSSELPQLLAELMPGGVPPLAVEWLADPFESVRKVNGETVLVAGDKAFIVPQELSSVIEQSPVDRFVYSGFASRKLAEQGFVASVCASGLVALRSYIEANMEVSHEHN